VRGTTIVTREFRGEKSRDALAQSPELQSTIRQAIFASGPIRPGRREAAARTSGSDPVLRVGVPSVRRSPSTGNRRGRTGSARACLEWSPSFSVGVAEARRHSAGPRRSRWSEQPKRPAIRSSTNVRPSRLPHPREQPRTPFGSARRAHGATAREGRGPYEARRCRRSRPRRPHPRRAQAEVVNAPK